MECTETAEGTGESLPARPASWWFRTERPPRVDSPLPQRADVVVAGAGLTGIATALVLARQGRRVVVVEGRFIGAVTTGHTTGKLSLLQGDVLGELRARAGDAALAAYVEGNRAGQDWIRAEADGHPEILQDRAAVTFATTPEGDEKVAREAAALDAAGISVHTLATGSSEAPPFPLTSGLVLRGQAQLHAVRLLDLLAARLRAAGGTIVEGCRLQDATLTNGGVRAETTLGTIDTAVLVLATGTPVLDRGLFFAKLEPSRALVGAYSFARKTALPHDMYLSVDPEPRSFRTATDADGGDVLVVGSGGFTPGRIDSTAARLAALDSWTGSRFPGAHRLTWWAAQDYKAVNHLPFAGALPRGGGRIFAATGFNKWGMTNAAAAAIAIAGSLDDDRPEWARRLDEARPVMTSAGEATVANAEVAGHLASGWAKAETRMSESEPPEGTGRVGRVKGEGLEPVATATVGGTTCSVSAVCTHLNGIVTWNDAERSWDCPLHGSRFDHRGRVLEGPATRDLATRDSAR